MGFMFVHWLILAGSVWFSAAVLPGVRIRGGFWGALVVAGVFGFLNFLLAKLLFLVIGIGTLGIGFLLAFLTRWVVNALLLKLTDTFSERIEIDGFGWALGAAALMSGVGTLLERLVT